MTTALFQDKSVYSKRLLAACMLALIFLVLDWRTSVLDGVRSAVSAGLAPIRYMVAAPVQVVDWSSDALVSRASLLEENARLRAQLFVMERRSQQLLSLEVENDRLRELLNASEVLDDQFISAELVGVDPDPFTHQVILNRGSVAGAYTGQPVIDAEGLVGQVIETGPLTSRVLLLGDSEHAVPVQVNRNGVRTTVSGTGDLNTLELLFVPETADIRVGDLLITSGLGGRFPRGYPVAEVTEVTNPPGAQFARVRARPLSNLDRTRHVLLVDTQRPSDDSERTAPQETQ